VSEIVDFTEPTAEVRLSQGAIRYRDAGHGEPIAFVHGALVDGSVWRKVAPLLVDQFRCIVPDWPMGSHRIPMSPDADLSALGMARLVADFLAALGLDQATLVGSDTGGGICQLVATRHPERLVGLVLTNCDACDDFPPFPLKATPYLVRVPGVGALIAHSFRLAAVRRVGGRLIAKHGIPDDVLERWARPGFSDRGIRRDTIKLIRSLSPRLTREARAGVCAGASQTTAQDEAELPALRHPHACFAPTKASVCGASGRAIEPRPQRASGAASVALLLSRGSDSSSLIPR
jgi:pimeloyl-ACP methyl ester carboxylesterase